MKDIICKMPWDLYADYKEVREKIRNLQGYSKLKQEEQELMKSLFVVSMRDNHNILHYGLFYLGTYYKYLKLFFSHIFLFCILSFSTPAS